MALLGCVIVADHIMWGIVELFDLLIGSSDAVIGNNYRAVTIISHNTNINFTALFIMVDTVLDEIADRPF